jgi:hypothetical protein
MNIVVRHIGGRRVRNSLSLRPVDSGYLSVNYFDLTANDYAFVLRAIDRSYKKIARYEEDKRVLLIWDYIINEFHVEQHGKTFYFKILMFASEKNKRTYYSGIFIDENGGVPDYEEGLYKFLFDSFAIYIDSKHEAYSIHSMEYLIENAQE